MRQYLGLPNTADIQLGDEPTLDLVKDNIISGLGATTTLTNQQSNSVIMLDRAAGIVVTLPAATPGIRYRFVVSVAVTSNVYKIVTSAGTVLMTGALVSGPVNTTPAAGTGPFIYQGNGSTHVAVSMNGTTTGGLIGTVIDCFCVTSTSWQAYGTVVSSGTLATPFST
jgi:hypothetical protein